MEATKNIHTNGAGYKSKSPGADAFEDAEVKPDAAQDEGVAPKLFQRLSLAQVTAMPTKPWLVDQIIGPGDLGMIFGAPGSGKTFVALDLAFSACLGKDFAGRFEVSRPLTVAYAAGEGGSGLAQRFQAAAEYYGVIDSDLPNLHIFTTVPQLYDSKDPCNAAQFVIEYAEAQAADEVAPLDLLILDTLHSVTSGADENSAQHMGEVLRQAKRISDSLGCAIILVHHSNKAGTGERGSSALRGAMDTMIEVKEVGNGRVMTCEKLKDGEQWKPQTFDLIAKADSVRVDWGQVGESSNSKSKRAENSETLRAFLMSNPGRGFAAKHLAGLIAGSESDVHKAMKPLVDGGGFSAKVADEGKSPGRGNPILWAYTGSDS